jgi:hypothetical protein
MLVRVSLTGLMRSCRIARRNATHNEVSAAECHVTDVSFSVSKYGMTFMDESFSCS